MRKQQINYEIALGALFAALSYVAFMFLRVDIYLGVTRTSFHIANSLVVLAPIFLGAPVGIFAPALGLFLADLFSNYAYAAPETLYLKTLMAALAYLVLTKFYQPHYSSRKKHLVAISAMAAGLLLNVLLAPVSSYFYKRLIGMQVEAASIFLKFHSGVVFVNAFLSLLAAVALYLALAKALDNEKFHTFLPKWRR